MDQQNPTIVTETVDAEPEKKRNFRKHLPIVAKSVVAVGTLAGATYAAAFAGSRAGVNGMNFVIELGSSVKELGEELTDSVKNAE